MSTYSTFKTDTMKERQGVWHDLGDAGAFLLGRAGGSNVGFGKKLATLTTPHRRAIQHGEMREELANSILIQVYAENVVLAWEGVTDSAGQPLPFNKENCIKLLSDLPDLFVEIKRFAENSTLYREELQKADSENLSSPSSIA